MDTSFHIQKLRESCRISGHHIEGKTCLKGLFKLELKVLFHIDIDDDVDEIHPPYICKVHARFIYRYRETGKFTQEDTVPYCFVPHSVDCNICIQTKTKGRPPKRSSSKTGVVTKQYEISDISSAKKRSKTESQTSSTSQQCTDTENEKVLKSSHYLIREIRKCLDEMKAVEKDTFFSHLTDTLKPEERSDLCYYLGRAEQSSISGDVESMSLLHKDVKALSNINLFDWTMKRNRSVLLFLFGIGNLVKDFNKLHSSKNDLSLVRAVEQIYMLQFPNFISPLSFLMNVCLYTMTGSKTAVDLLGTSSPAGHYKSVMKWLHDIGSQEPICPDGDIMNVFDNEQVIGRKNVVKPGHKISISVITNKGVVVLDPTGNLQHDICLKPLQILRSKDKDLDQSAMSSLESSKAFDDAVSEILDQSSERCKQMETDHYTQLYFFIDTAIEHVQLEQQDRAGTFFDKIDDLVKKECVDESGLTCALCGTLNGKRKIVCEGCKQREGIKQARQKKVTSDITKPRQTVPRFIKLQFEKNVEENSTYLATADQSRYEHVHSNHTEAHEIILTDPVFCNPNSMETVARVLRKIGLDNDIVRYGGTKRHWTFICCDGLPYLICKKLKEQAVICTIGDCSEKFLSKKQYFSHVKVLHADCENGQFIYEFDWFYLRIGAGHYEMNLIKSFFELNWIPFMEVLCERMGFVSEAAKLYAKTCKDLHKSWNLLLIFHAAALRELVLPYVRLCMGTSEKPNAKGFFKYSETTYKSKDRPNYKYLMDQVVRFSQGIINFRMGIRRNNSDLCKSGKHMTKELFHGRSHPKYQSIEIYDSLQDVLMPENVKILNDSFASIITGKSFSAGEDFDFILEEKNRQLKSWIPKGIPSDEIWQTVCRNNNVLEKVRNDTLKMLRVASDKQYLKWPDLEESVESYRCILRKTDYLNLTGDHTSLSGLILDDELTSFLGEATKRRIHTIHSDILCKDIGDLPKMRHPIPITLIEKEKLKGLDKKTVPELQAEILKTLEIIPNEVQYEYHAHLYQSVVKGKKKEQYIVFLNELKDALAIDTEDGAGYIPVVQ